jgi:hypothetical protein
VCFVPGVVLELAYVTNQLVMTSPADIQVPPIYARLNALPIYAGAFWRHDVIAGCLYLTAFTIILARVTSARTSPH